ncbi:FAD-dependent oxidoreductase [candidate division KSB1 bacterium]|nr:FAD-dependent oxidoreductase [candidate division KSB1 bacterium]
MSNNEKQNKMIRTVENLENKNYDLLIIGGGIYGATAAWDASLRGLSVALVEKNDYASGTSFNSLKIVHGGLRYLQHFDFKRMRESIQERRILSKIAPHLVFPLPCAMPTKGHLAKGPEAMRIGLLMNDLISFDRNRDVDKEKRIPAGRMLSREQLFEIIPFIEKDGYNGGILWHDAQMYSSERLVLSFLHSAARRGADLANHVEVLDFMIEKGRVKAVRAVDKLSGKTLQINAKMTLNCAGPGLTPLLEQTAGGIKSPAWSTALNLVLNRSLSKEYAFGVFSTKTFRDKDALISRGSRLLFVVPWQGITLIGTDHKPYYGDPGDYRVTQKDIDDFLGDVQSAMPKANIRKSDIAFYYGGLLPMTGVNEESGDIQLLKHFRLIDHEKADRLPGLISLQSVKYTTARGVAEKAIDLVQTKLGDSVTSSKTADIPVWGGDIDDYHRFVTTQLENYQARFNRSLLLHLIRSYGSEFENVLSLIDPGASPATPVAGDQSMLKAQVLYAVRNEMAKTVSDVVLRRTELGSKGAPGSKSLSLCADVMAAELGWSDTKRQQEVEATKRIYDIIEQ